jgi:cell wall integrity and stress response component
MPTGATSSTNTQQTQKKKISSGGVIGIAVGVVVAALVLIALLVVGCCVWRRRKYGNKGGEQGLNRNTSVLSRKILLGGSGGTNGTPYAANNAAMQEKRSSKPLVTDQRLNPNAFMQHDDGSRSSFVSMQDNRDYTRTLNVGLFMTGFPCMTC